ncbi:uncharacterized protein LOC112523170 [Cynara cardunculus var. scolymus]|uniref:uncharacterized protein LOC112523170 n=1 Tax=Cynara cardunculus var. scolymus TaxID=59895 RepID=UPI000D624E25|nr:uncharacterized protein LOC112523170 [Cynara cardunculus var. scolymus]XP_024988425.1 uncharacterized protein LOC112523170 [Cynara cardunculus var. scolymus]
MPPGRRGSAKKKKKKPKDSKKSLSSNAARPPHGESDGAKHSSSKSQKNSPHPVVKTEKRQDNSSGNQSLTIDRTKEAAKETQGEIEINGGSNSQKSHEKREDNSSGNQSLTTDRTEKAANKTQSEIEINRGSNSQKSHEKSSSSRSKSSNDKSHVDIKEAVVIQPAAVADLVQPAKETQSEIEIDRGSNSRNSLEKSSSSKSSSSNDKSHVDKKKAVVIQPAAVADLVQPAKETQSESEIDRGSTSHNSLEKSSSSRSSCSNDMSHVDKKKAVVILPAAVANLVQHAKETQSGSEIDRGSNSHNSLEKRSSSRSSSSNDKCHVDKNKAVVIQPAAVADLVQPIESLVGNRSCELGDLAVTDSPIVDPAKPVSSLVELASQVFDNTKLEEKNDLVVAETPLEQNSCPTSTSEVVGSVPKENEVEKLVPSDDKASPKSNGYLPASTNGACSFCGRNTNDRVNEPKTPECSEKQPLLGSAPQPAEKTSWKSCCGIFELCSGSSR